MAVIIHDSVSYNESQSISVHLVNESSPTCVPFMRANECYVAIFPFNNTTGSISGQPIINNCTTFPIASERYSIICFSYTYIPQYYFSISDYDGKFVAIVVASTVLIGNTHIIMVKVTTLLAMSIFPGLHRGGGVHPGIPPPPPPTHTKMHRILN